MGRRYRRHERRRPLHQGGLQNFVVAARDAGGFSQRLLVDRFSALRQDLRHDWPPVHHRPRRRDLLHRRAAHGPRPFLLVPHRRKGRRRNRSGLLPHDCPGLHGGGLPLVDARLPHLPPGGVHQRRHSTGLRRQLLVRRPPPAHQLAADARPRRRPGGRHRRGRHVHAGVAAVAGHERADPGGEARPPADLRERRGGGYQTPGDNRRRHTQPRGHRFRQLEREKCVEGAPPPLSAAPPDSVGGDRDQFLHAGLRQRRGGVLHAGGFQIRRDPQKERANGSNSDNGDSKDHMRVNICTLLGPLRKKALIVIGLNWNGNFSSRVGPGVQIPREPGPQTQLGRSNVRGDGLHRCVVFLDWAWAHHVGLLVGDFPEQVAGPRVGDSGVG